MAQVQLVPGSSVRPRDAHKPLDQPPKQHPSQMARAHAKAIAARQLSWRVGAAASKRTSNTALRVEQRAPRTAPWCPLWQPTSDTSFRSDVRGGSLHEHNSSAPAREEDEPVSNKVAVTGGRAQDGMHAYYLALYLTEARPRPGKCPGWTMDPFCPLETRPEERILFQHYLRLVPPLMYGCNTDSPFNPVREISMPCGYMFYSQLRWMLISAQNVVSAQTKSPWPPSMYRHQVEAYRELNEDLADPERRYSFEAMINLTCAVHVENRTAGPQRARLHLKALERIREGRKGRFIEQSGSTFAVIRACSYTTYLLCECELDSLGELNVAKKMFLNKVQKIQDWRRAHATAGATECGKEPLVALPDAGARLAFAQAESDFARNPHIQKVLQIPTSYTTYQHIAALFSVLLFIHISMHDIGLQLAPAFLSRTITLVNSSAMSDSTTGTSLFKLPALCMVVSKVVVDVMQGHSAYAFKLDDDGEDESSHLRGVIIEGLKFFSYLGQETRMRFVRLLMSWLTEDTILSVDSDDEYNAERLLQHGDWNAMCSEADTNWHVEQQKGQGGH